MTSPDRQSNPRPETDHLTQGRSLDSGSLLDALMDTIPDSIYFKDLQSRFIRVSRAKALKNGFGDPAEMHGLTDYDIYSKQHADEAMADEQALICGKKPIIVKDEQLVLPSSRISWVSATKVPLRDGNGKIVGTIGISRDITERHYFQEELAKSRDELEALVAERTADLRLSNKKLEDRVTLLNFLNSGLASLAKHISLETLAPAVLNSFRARFAGAEAALCLRSGRKWELLSASAAFGSPADRAFPPAVLDAYNAQECRGVMLYDCASALQSLQCVVPSALGGCTRLFLIPLPPDTSPRAALLVFGRGNDPLHLDKEEITMLELLAAYAAVCLANVLHIQELNEQARLAGELEAARKIQQQLIPGRMPTVPRIAMATVYLPAYEVGGDYLDYFRNEAGQWVIVIADICGKGMPAALLMAMVRSVFRMEAATESSPRRILCRVNRFLCGNIDERSFVSALCCVIDAEGTAMKYARAGHPPLIRLPAPGRPPEPVAARGIALGILDKTGAFEEMIEEKTLQLSAGERYLMYTDGLIEEFNSRDMVYGAERLQQALRKQPDVPPDGMLDGIMDDIRAFTKRKFYHDDLTALCLHVTG